MTLRMALAGSLLVLLTACGSKSPQEVVDGIQAELNSGNFAAASTAAQAALGTEAIKADKALTWRVEKLRLDALAGEKQAAEILAGLTRLKTSNPAQVDAALYASLAGKLSQGHDYLGAIDVVHAGIEQFPDQKARFEGELKNLTAAATAASESGDNAALEKLRSLGYL